MRLVQDLSQANLLSNQRKTSAGVAEVLPQLQEGISGCKRSLVIGPTTRLIFPFEGLSQGLIEIVDKGQHLVRQIVDGGKIAPFEQPSHENTEPNFNLIEPGGMFWGVDKLNSMGRVSQKRFAGFHRLKNA